MLDMDPQNSAIAQLQRVALNHLPDVSPGVSTSRVVQCVYLQEGMAENFVGKTLLEFQSLRESNSLQI